MACAVASIAFFLSTSGCGSDTTGPGIISPSVAYWALQLNAHALNMAVGSTFQLHAAAVTVSGTPVAGAGAVTFTTPDSTLHVTPDGMLSALYSTQGTARPVVATLTVNGVTLDDTVNVQVIDAAPATPLTVFSVQPAGGDSTKIAVDRTKFLSVYATTAAGDVLRNAQTNNLLVAFTSSDPTVATIDPQTGFIQPQRPGVVTFSASTVAYGVSMRDSVQYHIGAPLLVLLQVLEYSPRPPRPPYGYFYPSVATVGYGGRVIFGNTYADTVDIAFTDTSAIRADQSFASDGDCNGTSVDISASAFRFVGDTNTTELATCDETSPNAAVAFLSMTLTDGSYPFTSHAIGSGGVINVKP